MTYINISCTPCSFVPIGTTGRIALANGYANVNAMKEVAAQEQVLVIDQYKYLTNSLHGQSTCTICPDGLHPTDAVYSMKGSTQGVFSLNLFPANLYRWNDSSCNP
jgi:hypothetical protein